MKRAYGLAAAALMTTSFARAEPVRVTAGNASGEGWTFDDGGTCSLVTARHVVERNGRLASPMLVDSAGVAGQGIDPLVPPGTLQVGGAPMDAARLRVVGELHERCADDLGYEDLGPTLDRIKLTGQPLYLEKVLPGGSAELVPASVSTINRDGKRFTIAIPPGGAEIVASDSGSPVRLRSTASNDRGLPLGLVTEVLDDGEAVVLRMDAIRTWVRGVPAPMTARSGIGAFRIIRWSATTPDPACGPTNMLVPGENCGWRAQPLPGKTTVDVDVSPPTGAIAPVSGITVELELGSSVTGVEVEARDAGNVSPDAAWDPLAYCPAPADDSVITCRFAPRADSMFRIRMDGLKGGLRTIVLR